MRRRSELSCFPSLSRDRSGLTGAGGWRSSIPLPPPLLPGGWRGGCGCGRGRAGERTRIRLKSGEVCAQRTAGKEGAGKVSLLDFGEVGIKHGDKADAF